MAMQARPIWRWLGRKRGEVKRRVRRVRRKAGRGTGRRIARCTFRDEGRDGLSTFFTWGDGRARRGCGKTRNWRRR